MTQTRLSSLLEAVFNVAVGFVVSVLITAVVLPVITLPSLSVTLNGKFRLRLSLTP